VPDGTVNATPDCAVVPANHKQAGTNLSAPARRVGAAPTKRDIVRSLVPLAVIASAIGAARIPGVRQGITALMGSYSKAVPVSWPNWDELSPLPPDDTRINCEKFALHCAWTTLGPAVALPTSVSNTTIAAYPLNKCVDSSGELDEPSPLPPDDRPWINCEKFDTLHCTSTSLANAVALSPSVDTRAAAAQTLKKCVESAWDYANFIEFPPIIEVLTQRMWQGSFNSTRNSLDAASALATLFPDASNRINETAAAPHITRLLSDPEIAVQELALNALRRIVHVPRIRTLVAAEGAAEPLVRLLQHGAADVQETAAYVVGALISSSEQNKVLFEHAGAIPVLLQLLSGGSEAVKEAVAYALDQYAVASSSYQELITAGGAVHSLLQLLKEGGDRAKRRAICGLTALARLPENRQTLRDTNAFSQFLEAFRAGDQDLKWEVVEALKILVQEAENVAPITEAGAVPLLTDFVTVEGGGSNPFVSQAVQETINKLTSAATATDVRIVITQELMSALLVTLSSPHNKALLSRGSIVSQLILSLAADMEVPAKHTARYVIGRLGIPATYGTPAGEEAAMATLVQHLTADADEIKHATVEVLKEAATRDSTSRQMMVAAGVIPLLVQVLGSGSKSYTVTTLEALGALAMDVDSKRLIVEGGAVPLLIQYLAENDGAGWNVAYHALQSLVTRTTTEDTIAAPEAFPMLLQLLSNSTNAVMGRVLRVLREFAHDVSVREALTAAGVKPVLHQLKRRHDQIGSDAAATIGAGKWW
jgi:hypothetical protein